MAEFFQEGPRLANPYDADRALRRCLARLVPAPVLAEIEPGLRVLGDRAAGEMLALAAEAEVNPPRHVPFDAWGRRIDRIDTSAAWERLHAIAAEEGIVATAYERRHGALSRLHQFARLYLFHPSSAIVSCPLAMTDGAARVLEVAGSDELRARALPRLLARDPAIFRTAGQWMTERSGGSDVGGTETVARRVGSGFRLFGNKWFTSATTSPIAMTLARCEGAPAGSRGLTLFYVELRDDAGALSGVRVLRLKDKLGTRALPTAELELDGVPAWQVSAEGRGVAAIATVLNVTRLYNSCCAAGYLGRGLQLARDYAERRRAFGQRLAEQPLHVETLAGLAVEHAAAVQLTFRCAELCGRHETGEATAAERALLRLLTPIAKALTARQSVAGVSEALEAFGGAGYVEDTGLPVLLRDAQVLSIWEGTTNVLALDALRAAAREEALPPLVADLERLLATARGGALVEAAHRLRQLAGACQAWWRRTAPEGGAELEIGARAFALGLGRAYAGALLVAQAAWEIERGEGDWAEWAVALARRFAEGHLSPPPGSAIDAEAVRRIVFPGTSEVAS